jgi:hypothetical protein
MFSNNHVGDNGCGCIEDVEVTGGIDFNVKVDCDRNRGGGAHLLYPGSGKFLAKIGKNKSTAHA